MTTDPAPTSFAASSPIVTLRVSLRGLYDSAAHCRDLADFVARFAASDRSDPGTLTTRLSTYLHGALELVFRARPADGELVVAVGRTGELVVVELALPTDVALAGQLRRDLGRAFGPGAQGGAEPARDAGLRELVTLHGVALALREGPGVSVIILKVPHA